MEAGKDRNPLISIIIPVYNGEKYIGECIRSVCAQTWKKTEILVVDDGSTDETAKHVSMYADRDPRIRLIRLSENRQLFHLPELFFCQNRDAKGLGLCQLAASCFPGEHIVGFL